MTPFEWWGERKNPGTVGHVSSHVPLPSTVSAVMLYARGLVGLSMIAGAVFLIVQTANPEMWFALFAVYLIVAYRIRVRPDYSNIGWMGGFIDHPFRWSDDVNRQLAFLRVVLLPGRFAIAAMRDALGRVRGKRSMVFRRTELDPPDSEA